jgi:uncharacterized delta-60 repeat protein
MSFRIGRIPRLLALLCGAALCIATLSIGPSVFAADGDLDPTFNGTGIVTTNNAPVEEARDLVIQPDGKIVVAGSAGTSSFFNGTLLDFQLARYNPDGSLDTTFGSGGIVTTDIDEIDTLEAVALQPDGRIVVTGATSSGSVGEKLVLVRYNADGSLDTTFGSGGIVRMIGGAGVEPAQDLVIQPDGRIVVAGGSYDEVSDTIFFTVYRFDTNGSFDATFGSGGIAIAPFSGFAVGHQAYGVALQADGRIVVAGTGRNGAADTDFAVARFNTDGSFDTTFGSGGYAFTDVSGTGEDDVARDLVIQPDGKIVVVGYPTESSEGAAFGVTRYNADGSPDTTFGAGGVVVTTIAGDTQADGVTLGAGGTIVVAGKAMAILRVARYDSSGSLDPSFGASGIVTTPVGSDSAANAVAVQSDGKIVAAGLGNRNLVFPDFFSDFAVVRYQGTPPPPPSPTSKDQCKNGGWQTFTNPSFKSQGACIKYVNGL